MLGKRFGKLVVQERIRRHPTIKKDSFYRCVCDCGNVCEARRSSLKKGQKKSCGCLFDIATASPWVGQKVGQLQVLERLPGKKYRCLCDCGAEIVSTSMWSRAKTGDANCRGPAHRKPKPVKPPKVRIPKPPKVKVPKPVKVKMPPPLKVVKPAVSKHFLYHTWAGMVDRCYSAACASYANYGGRGIQVYASWRQDFWAYASYVDGVLGPRPALGYSLDRKDNDGHYEPGNLRWATPSQQMRNTRVNVATAYGGTVYHSRVEAYEVWCLEGCPEGTVFTRNAEIAESAREARLEAPSRLLASLARFHRHPLVRTTDDLLLSKASGETKHHLNLFFFNRVWRVPAGLWAQRMEGGKRVLELLDAP